MRNPLRNGRAIVQLNMLKIFLFKAARRRSDSLHVLLLSFPVNHTLIFETAVSSRQKHISGWVLGLARKINSYILHFANPSLNFTGGGKQCEIHHRFSIPSKHSGYRRSRSLNPFRICSFISKPGHGKAATAVESQDQSSYFFSPSL